MRTVAEALWILGLTTATLFARRLFRRLGVRAIATALGIFRFSTAAFLSAHN